MDNERVMLMVGALLCRAAMCLEHDPAKPNVVVETVPVAVKGFPLVMRLTMTGEQVAPLTSVFGPTAEVIVRLRNLEQGKAFVIAGYNQGEEITLMTKEGGLTPSGASAPS